MANSRDKIEDLLDELYEVLDKGWSLPLSNGKVFVDGEHIRALIEEIREATPVEILKAQEIIDDSERILQQAQIDAENTMKIAQDKIKKLITKENIVKEAQLSANELILQGQAKFKEMKKASDKYIDDMMLEAEKNMTAALAEIKKTRQSFNTKNIK